MKSFRLTLLTPTGFALGLVYSISLASVQANGFRNPPEGAASLGKSSGKIAHVDDASAVTHNPANLKGPSLLAGGTFAHSETDFDGAGRSGSTDNEVKLLPHLYGVYDLDENWTLGLGIHAPFGQSTEWKKSGPFRFDTPYFAEVVTINLNPSAAYRIADNLRVGAGLDLFYSELDFRQLLANPMDPAAPPGRLQTTGDGTGVGFNLAVTWEPVEDHTVAATYRSAVEIDYDGDTKLARVPPPLPGRSNFESEIEFPAIVGLGYGLQATEQLRVGIDVEWIEFSNFDELPLDLGAAGAFLPFPPAIPQNWDDTWTIGVGGDYQVDENWMLRAAWTWLESPIPEETLAPTLPDADRHVFSFGFGYQQDNHHLDVAYAISVYDGDVSGNVVPAFDGDYDITAQLLAITYGLDF